MSSEQITQETVPVETTSTETPQPTATPKTVSGGDTPASWKSSISEEFRNDPNIEKFTEIDALAKSYLKHTYLQILVYPILSTLHSIDLQLNFY